MVTSAYAFPAQSCPHLPRQGEIKGSESQLARVQALSRGLGAEPESLDPVHVQTGQPSQILYDLFEGLTALTNAGRVTGGIAQSWARLDPNTWAFHLRATNWSNGEALTASDVVYSIERLFDPVTASMHASSFQSFFLNGQAVVEGRLPVQALGVWASDPHTVEVRTPYPVPFMPEMLAHHAFLPVHRATVERHGDQWAVVAHMVSNGPFKLKEWRHNDRLLLEKNKRYWDVENVRLDRIVFRAIDDPVTEVKLYLSGELDITNALPAGTCTIHEMKRPNELVSTKALGLRYYIINTADPLLRDRRVRQALSMVLDREALAERVLGDGQAPAYSIVVEGLRGVDVVPYAWSQWPLAKRVAYARELLAQADVPVGTSLTMLFAPKSYQHLMTQFLAEQWRAALGLEVTLDSMDQPALREQRRKRRFQIARDAWTVDYNDATSMLAVVRCDSKYNRTGYCNRDAERILNDAENASTTTTRVALQTRAATMIMDDYVIIPVVQMTYPRLVKNYVGGYGEGNAMDRYRSRDFFITRH